MKYHETVPSEHGDYWSRYGIQRIASTTGRFIIPTGNFMLGPLPSTNDEAVALTCEVQFARMEVAWIMKSPFRLSSNDIRASYADSRVRFAIEGERSLSLYRDMERVTKELGG